VLLLLLFPIGTILGLLILFVLFAWIAPRSLPWGVVLPALFLIVVTPLAVFVASGAGTHMSPLMLYPFALPWALLFEQSRPGTEIQALLLSCAINAALLTCAGLLLDRRRAKAATASRRADSGRP
jgi:Flp pilus assembly protein protease CpaA